MIKIAFHIPYFCVRGTSVAVWDYANYNEILLKNQSLIVLPLSDSNKSDKQALTRFVNRFSTRMYKDIDDLERILEEEKCNIFYCIKYGRNDGIVSKKIKSVIHCVFDMSEPHGNVYAGVSQTLAKKFGSNLYVPHMIGLKPSETKENLRKQLNIPEDAVVFGRYGGEDTFNIPFCWGIINYIVNKREDIYFIFINTQQVVKHPHIFYLSKIVDEADKNRFICTCDAHLECGTLGHSFGLAIGENSVNNIPIIAYKSPDLWNTAHIDILGDKGIYFQTEKEFYDILNNFKPSEYKDRDLNCYKDYSPEKVMDIFQKIFIN